MNERGRGLVRGLAGLGYIGGQIVVVVPAAMINLHKPHAALDQSPRQQAVVGKGSFARLSAVPRDDFFRFPFDIHQFRNAGLHPIRHFKSLNARGDFRIRRFIDFQFIQFAHAIEQATAGLVAHARRIGDEQNRFAFRAKLDALMIAGEESTAPITRKQWLVLPGAGSQDDKRG